MTEHSLEGTSALMADRVMVELPPENSLEAHHVLAWRTLLRTTPAVEHRILDLVDVKVTEQFVSGATYDLWGGCGADLFLRCLLCGGDRMVYEVKGPGKGSGVVLNWQKETRSRPAEYQTARYTSTYLSAVNGSLCSTAAVCECVGGSPVLVLLDNVGRTREQLENEYGRDAGLENWFIVSYEDALRDCNDPVASWLKGVRGPSKLLTSSS